jgi:ParB family transcriptional regulator, chromosome partitioning protein
MYKRRNTEVLRLAKGRRPQDDKVDGRTDNLTTATAGNLAGHPEKDKEKVEKRRALGRGLESLLPGPRVVPAAVPVPTGGADAGTRAGAPAPHSPREAAAQVAGAGVASQSGEAAELRSAGQPGAAVPTLSTRAVVQDVAVPHPVVIPSPSSSAIPGAPAAPVIATGGVDYDPFGETANDGVIEIQAVADTRVPSNLVVNVAISDIDKNPFQTRLVDDDDALEELADSIKANGVVQPIVVRPAEEEGRYILILGERRLHASKKAGKTHVPSLVRRVSEQQAAEMTIVENLQREDLSPMEQAESFRVLSNRFSMTQQQIAERVGLSRVSVANYMRLLKLPREVMQMLAEKRINFAKAKELLKLGDNDRIAEAAVYAVNKGMNIEQVEMLVLRMDGLLDPLPGMPGVKKEKTTGGARWVDPNVRSAQVDLERMLGVRVRIRDRKGRGKIVIEYSTVDDYERVVGMLRGKK